MAYNIFDETMVDLSWKDVEAASKKNTTILLPVSVIEEHGPHMDLAPDVYLAHKLVKNCRKELKALGINSLIAPPFYWGINNCTGAFPGSFTVREETMIMLLTDIVTSLKSWGFTNIYIVNCHGDYKHIHTICKAAKSICENEDINVKFIFDADEYGIYKVDSYASNILQFSCEDEDIEEFSYSDFADIHAGGAETSSMLKDFPNSVNSEMLKELADSTVPWEQLHNWHGKQAREITPLGYCGNPSNINIEDIRKWDAAIAVAIAKSIQKDLLDL